MAPPPAGSGPDDGDWSHDDDDEEASTECSTGLVLRDDADARTTGTALMLLPTCLPFADALPMCYGTLLYLHHDPPEMSPDDRLLTPLIHLCCVIYHAPLLWALIIPPPNRICCSDRATTKCQNGRDQQPWHRHRAVVAALLVGRAAGGKLVTMKTMPWSASMVLSVMPPGLAMVCARGRVTSSSLHPISPPYRSSQLHQFC